MNKPTKRVGPGGVQRIQETADYEFLGDDHVHEPEQTIIVTLSLDVWTEERCRGQLLYYRARLTVRAEFCVGMAVSFAHVMVYEFDAPNDDDSEKQAREEIRSGRALYCRDFIVNDGPHYDRNKPNVEVIICDPYEVLRWLGTDFATAATQEQNQLSDTQKLIT